MNGINQNVEKKTRLINHPETWSGHYQDQSELDESEDWRRGIEDPHNRGTPTGG